MTLEGGAATGKARSPIVVLRVGGTTSADVYVEHSRLLESLSVTHRIAHPPGMQVQCRAGSGRRARQA